MAPPWTRRFNRDKNRKMAHRRGVLLALVIIASTALVIRHDGLIMKAVNTVVRRPLSSDRSTLLEIAAGWILVAAIDRGRAVTGSASVAISINSRVLDPIASIARYRKG